MQISSISIENLGIKNLKIDSIFEESCYKQFKNEHLILQSKLDILKIYIYISFYNVIIKYYL